MPVVGHSGHSEVMADMGPDEAGCIPELAPLTGAEYIVFERRAPESQSLGWLSGGDVAAVGS